jgi:addiction module HigA family antidote
VIVGALHIERDAGENLPYQVALVSAVKRGDAYALGLLGYGQTPRVSVEAVTFTPKRVRIGGRVTMKFGLKSSMKIPFQRLNGIVKGRRAVSADTALLLEALTGWDAQIWLTLQAKWDLWHALKARGSRPKVRPLRRTA